ncbi:MAG TPA: hypothetical protein VFT16_05925 [Candidatus Saccharimonadales bacterium]|nr:hypothetical protein [Candidatus Saccharimonadales bacterium]
MDELTVEIKDSYGIEELSHNFIFNNSITHAHTHIVYAQNGTMKSSMARTFLDFQKGNPIRDHIYGRNGSFVLKDENGTPISVDNVLSIPSFDSSGYECEQMSLLVASEDLKGQYDGLLKKYAEALEVFLKKLKDTSGIKRNIDPSEIIPLFCSLFGKDIPDENFVHILKTSRTEIESAPDFFQSIRFPDVDNGYVSAFIDANKDFLQDFVSKYDEVMQKSSYLRGEFGTGNAQKVADALDSEKFFTASHKVVLLSQDGKGNEERIVDNPDELKELFQSEFDKIFADPKVKVKFQKTLKKLDQANHADFKRILTNTETRPIVGYLGNYTLLKRRMWFSYLKKHLDEMDELIKLKDEIKDDVADLVKKAKEENTEWDKAVEVFNRRFVNLPFTIEIKNKDSLILEGAETPSIQFMYNHRRRGKKPVDKKDIISYLSTGERKALYLLNLIFELQVRMKSGDPQVVLLDDVIDSFDYKNKYAFLEYLHELSLQNNNLYLIVLTHNFDFFRLMQSRFFGQAWRKNSWIAQKDDGMITLLEAGWFNPFPAIKSKAPRSKRYWLSLIPFARNIVEYCSGDQDNDFIILTSCLHMNGASPIITDISAILSVRIGVTTSPYSGNESVHDSFTTEADQILSEPLAAQIDLPNKILLAIAIRLTAEKFMRSKLTTAQVQAAINEGNVFTRELYNEFVGAYPNDDINTPVLDSVNLVTPENIHINAFMYEPLIDMGEDELRKLYQDVKAL